jgi:hypothetical protein
VLAAAASDLERTTALPQLHIARLSKPDWELRDEPPPA